MPETFTEADFQEAPTFSESDFEEPKPEVPDTFATQVPLTRAQLAAKQIGSDPSSAFSPFVPLGPDIKAQSLPGQILAAPYNVAKGFLEGMESRGGVALLPTGLAGKAAAGAVGVGFGLPAIKQGLQRVYSGTATGETQEALEGALQTITGGLITVGAAKPLVEEAAKILPKSATEATKPIERTEPSASEISKTTEIHGDVRPQQEPTIPLPEQESGQGVQPQTQAGVQQSQREVLLKPEEAKAAPAEQPGVPQPSAGLGGATMETPVAAGKTPQAMVEGNVTPQVTQVGSEPTIKGPQMGAAGIEEEATLPKGTGLKHAVDELEREGLGLRDAPEREQQSMVAAWEKSATTLEKDPALPEKLVGELLQNPNRGLSADESMALLRYKKQLLNSIQDAAEKTHVGDEASRKAAGALHQQLTSKLSDFLDAVHSRGSSAGLEFRLRQALVADDNTFTSRDDFNRFARSVHGNDLTPVNEITATKIAEKVKGATDAEQRALDAANKAVRENAIRIAKEESKGRVEDVVRKQQELDVQQKASQKALDAADDAVKKAVEQRKKAAADARKAATKSEREAAKVQEKAAAKAVKAADDLHRKAAIEHAKAQRAALGDPIKRVWDKVGAYIDKGETDFRDISAKVATDIGMSVKAVRRIMAQDARTKYLMDDAWKKQQEAQRLRQEAKRWVLGAETPELNKLIKSLPRFMFGIKVFGHGFVALGTHAPSVAFRPNYWNVYLPAYKTMAKMVVDKGFYQDQVDSLQRRPNYTTARRAGLVNDPRAYEDYTNPEIAKHITGGGAGARGFTILKILRQDMFDKAWSKLPRSMQTDEMAKAISQAINHDTGVANIPGGTKYLAVGLFAPRLEASRFMTLIGDPSRAAITFGKKATGQYVSPAEWHFAMEQVKTKATIAATVTGLLLANQQILNSVGSKQKVNFTDPFKSDWLKFKVAGMDFAYGNAMVSMMRLPVSLTRLIINDRKTRNLVYDDENFWTTLGRYARTQFSPFFGTAVDLGLGSDYASRPLPRKLFGLVEQNQPVPKRLRAEGFEQYTWPEYFSQQLAPIPATEAIKEVWEHGFGLNKEQMKAVGKALIISSVMGGTGGRLTEDRDATQTKLTW